MVNESVFINFCELFTGFDGRAAFRDAPISLGFGSNLARLSELLPSGGWQFRKSPLGFKSDFHCTTTPQILIVLQGIMRIGLQNGDYRDFKAGEGFYSNDVLPIGADFDKSIHGHNSAQIGDNELVTLFIRAENLL